MPLGHFSLTSFGILEPWFLRQVNRERSISGKKIISVNTV